MSFKANDNGLLNMSTKIWETVSSLMNINFDEELVYGDNDKYISTKIKSYGDKVNISFHENTKRKCIIQMFVTDNVRVCY